MRGLLRIASLFFVLVIVAAPVLVLGGGNDSSTAVNLTLAKASLFNEDFTGGFDRWELVNGATAALAGGVLSITPGAEGIALKLKDSVWQSLGSPADFYVEALIRPTSLLTGSNKNLGIASGISADNTKWYYAGFNGNGRMQTGTSETLKGYQNSGDGTVLASEKDFVYYKWRYEINNGVINFYCNDLYLGKNNQLANYTPGKGYTGTIGFYTCGGSFELAGVRVGRVAENQTKLIVETTDATLPRLWSKYLRWINGTSSTGIRVMDRVSFKITALDAKGNQDGWTAISTDPKVLELSAASGASGDTLTVKGVGVGRATVIVANLSDPGSKRSITYSVDPPLGYVADGYGALSNQVYPAVGAAAAYTDGELAVTFDSAPSIAIPTAAITINDYNSGKTVDVIYLTNDATVIGERSSTPNNAGSQRARIEGNTLYIAPHQGALAYNTKYYVAIANGVIKGTLNGKAFTGFSPESRTWHFTTKPAPVIKRSTITVDGSQTSTADFRTVQAALSYAQAKGIDAVIEIQPGVYNELLTYKSTKKLTLKGMGKAPYGADVIIQYKNGDKVNSGTVNRPLAYLNSSKTITLLNLTLRNAADKATYGQAEAIYFDTTGGTLIAKNCSFLSQQDTILTKGVNWFYRCLVEGDTDFIWGSASVSLFEECRIHCLSNQSYIFQARCPQGSKGYVLFNCEIETDAGEVSYFARSGGDPAVMDNVSLINCRLTGEGTIRAWYNKEVNPATPNPTPAYGSAVAGWKQYGLTDAANQPVVINCANAYTLTEAEYKAAWSSRKKILGKHFRF